MSSSSIISSFEPTDTVCPVCFESVHSEKPVGVTTGCGHIWHSECYHDWRKKGEYLYQEETTINSCISSNGSNKNKYNNSNNENTDAPLPPSHQNQNRQEERQEDIDCDTVVDVAVNTTTTTTTNNNSNNKKSTNYQRGCYVLNSHLNCLICNQPTKSFVELYIRLPAIIPNHKDLVMKLEHEFHTVSRRTQMLLEKEIARREFESTWLQEERQISTTAKERAKKRHEEKIQQLEYHLHVLKTNFQRKIKSIEEKRKQYNVINNNIVEHEHHHHQQQRRRSSSSSTTTTSIQSELLLNEPTFNSNSNSNLPYRSAIVQLQGNSSQSLSLESFVTARDDGNEMEREEVEEEHGQQYEQEHQQENHTEEQFSAAAAAADDDDDGGGIEEENHSNNYERILRTSSDLFDNLMNDNQRDDSIDNRREDDSFPSLNNESTVMESGSMDGNNQTTQNQSSSTRSDDPLQPIDSNHCQYTTTMLDSEISFATVPPPIATTSTAAINNTDSGDTNNNDSMQHLISPATPSSTTMSPRARRASRMIQKDTIFHPEDPLPGLSSSPTTCLSPHHSCCHSNTTRNRRSILKDEIFVPTNMTSGIGIIGTTAVDDTARADERKLPAMIGPTTNAPSPSCDKENNHRHHHHHHNLCNGFDFRKTPTASLSAEYERQRLQAETAYYQHQAELVEWELHQAEIELEEDELVLQQREQQIRQERSRLEESFTCIQRRVEETKQEARDRQKITAMEEKFIKYKIARCKEEERFEQELELLKQDENHILERERSEKQRQEMEKVRLKKELNELVKVMNKLEKAKELAKVAEEQSSASQSLESCVVCFEPLVNEASELGVAVPCGHTFHLSCFSGWEKSKRRRGSHVPCPLCNVDTNICVTIRFNRPNCSLYCSSMISTSSLAKHFQKEEGRWQRRRLIGLGMAGEASS